ncbi:unnamed protein product [Lactuca saligna]|uniref:Myosin motor domain-containing protein n=1 Tax=Lactuca saligna TaxID=75948 RepID=A0AA35ZBP1_LACSI|nr:unnamed protein product [Lactuca saligna]
MWLLYFFGLDIGLLLQSKAGPVLLAINPFKDVQIYGDDYVTTYRNKIFVNPHVYATADTAYNNMMKYGKTQSIVVGGESGSGKTETSNFALQYLASVVDVYSSFTSKAMSRHFRCLRDGIVSQIKVTKKAMGEKDISSLDAMRGETPRLRVLDQTLRQQRAFQQITMMDSHPWCPQRGLPE